MTKEGSFFRMVSGMMMAENFVAVWISTSSECSPSQKLAALRLLAFADDLPQNIVDYLSVDF
jgi:hypothetical protein